MQDTGRLCVSCEKVRIGWAERARETRLLMTMKGCGAGFALRPPGPSIRGWGLCVAA